MARFDDEAKRRAENERRVSESLRAKIGEASFLGGYDAYNFYSDVYNWRSETFFHEELFNGYNITTKSPRAGFIDGGIILKEGFILTDKMREDAPVDEWNVLSDFIDRMANIVADPILERKLYHVYDAVPVITTMEK